MIALAATLASLAAFHWSLELFSHYGLHYIALALIAAGLLAALRSWRWAAAALAVAGATAFTIAQNMSPVRQPGAANHPAQITVFHFNAGFRHNNPREVTDYILAHADRFDVVVLIESSLSWVEELKRLESAFPHTVRAPDDSPFGVAVLSKIKPATAEIISPPNGYRHIEMRLALPAYPRPLTIYAVHPPPPMSRELAQARNDKLRSIAGIVHGRPAESAVVVGDFNVTPFSPHFASFARTSALQPVQKGILPRPTWPVVLGTAWFGIAIDHSFVAPDLALVSREIGPALGSDHLPVTLTLAPK
jgi:endonuclease/exonuclease/phosphatase (EEP) superfamily protein YafD